MIVWGSQTFSRWWAAGKYRKRTAKGQYSLLNNLPQAALNYLSALGTVSPTAAAHEEYNLEQITTFVG